MEQELRFAEFDDEFLPDIEGVGGQEADFLEDFDDVVEIIAQYSEPKGVLIEDDEDVRLIAEMTEQLQELGYVAVEGMGYDDMDRLLHRVYSTREKEESALSKIVKDQAQLLQEVLEDVSSSYTTWLPNSDPNSVMDRISTLSADTTLGTELSQKANRWVNDFVRVNPECSAEDAYESFIKSGLLATNEYFFKQEMLYSYVETLLPVIKGGIVRRVSSFRTEQKRRESLACLLNQSEAENTKALLGAKAYALIRQVFVGISNSYQSICPVCGERFELKSPVFRLIAYATERGAQRRYFIEHISCECGTALMFTLDEYKRMFSFYAKECKSSIESYLSEAKIACRGASEMQVCVSIESVRDVIGHLLVDETAEIYKAESTDDKSFVQIDDLDYQGAVKHFYQKIKGFGRTAETRGKLEVSSGEFREQAASETLTDDEEGGSDRISYHDLAVYVTQCISKDYLIEKNRALFSLLQFLKGNTFLWDALSSDSIWALESDLAFLERYTSVKNPRLLTMGEMSTIQTLTVMLGIPYGDAGTIAGRECLLQGATGAILKLNELIEERKSERSLAMKKLYQCQDMLAYCKIMKVNTCKYEDLQMILNEPEMAKLLNDIADRMILRSFSHVFYDYWKTLRVIRESKLRNVLTGISEAAKIENYIDNTVRKVLEGYGCRNSGKAIKRFLGVYDRDVTTDEFLRGISDAVAVCDYYEFCKTLLQIPHFLRTDRDISTGINKIYEMFSKEAARVTERGKSIFYFTDFTQEEIAQCEEFNDLRIVRYVPIRLRGETPVAYCQRYETLYRKNGFYAVGCRDNAVLFRENGLDTTFLSLCAMLQQAEYSARGVSLFMSAMLEVAHSNMSVAGACGLLGISDMHYNIITSVGRELLILPDCKRTYKLMHGVYLTSVSNVMSGLAKNMSELNAEVKHSVNEIVDMFGIKDLMRDVLQMEYYSLDLEGQPENDQEEAEQELFYYAECDEHAFRKWVEG